MVHVAARRGHIFKIPVTGAARGEPQTYFQLCNNCITVRERSHFKNCCALALSHAGPLSVAGSDDMQLTPGAGANPPFAFPRNTFHERGGINSGSSASLRAYSAPCAGRIEPPNTARNRCLCDHAWHPAGSPAAQCPRWPIRTTVYLRARGNRCGVHWGRRCVWGRPVDGKHHCALGRANVYRYGPDRHHRLVVKAVCVPGLLGIRRFGTVRH